MSITKKFMISALTLSTAFALGISAQNVSNANASRYHYRYARRSHLRRNWNRRCHTGYFRRGVWHRYATGHFNRSWRWVPNRRRTRRYHIYYHGMNGGWTTSRRVYNANMRALKHAVKVHNRNVLRTAMAIHNRNTRTVRPKRPVKHYHMDYDGVDVGWTTNYNTYKKSIQWTKEAITKREQQLAAQQNDQDQSSDTNTDNDSGNQSQPAVTPKKQSNQNFANFEAEAKAQTIQDINNDREANGLQPYTEDQEMDNVAQVRANQNPTSHYNSQGQLENAIVAKQLGYHPVGGYYGENLYGDFIGKDEPGSNGISENTSNGIKAANASENDFVNNDASSNYGHRNNILNPNIPKVGVGVHCYKDQYGRPNYSLAEEFGY